jgi:hypothetical protein
MGYFDFLIDKGNVPDPNKEYIYRLDVAWRANKLEHEPYKKDSIVINVTQEQGGMYHFVDKLTGEEYRCSYNWAFADNTPENLLRIAEYEKLRKEYSVAKRKSEMAGDRIKTLKP